jgi:hypothetical protein
MRRVLLATGTAALLLLTGCTADGGAASSTPSPSASSSSGSQFPASSPAPASTVRVPSGVSLTAEGSRLRYGDSAEVIFEPTRRRGSVLRLTVRSVRKGRLADFDGFILADDYVRESSIYYAQVSVRNVGRGDVGGVAVPLRGVNKADVLLPAVGFSTRFPPCPTRRLPAKFANGARLSTCLVFLAPDKGTLASVSYRPSERFDPVTWSGTVGAPSAPRKAG